MSAWVAGVRSGAGGLPAPRALRGLGGSGRARILAELGSRSARRAGRLAPAVPAAPALEQLEQPAAERGRLLRLDRVFLSYQVVARVRPVQHDREGCHQRAAFQLGLVGIGTLETALVLEELAKACFPTASMMLGEIGVQGRIIATFAPEHLKRQYLTRLVAGDLVLSI